MISDQSPTSRTAQEPTDLGWEIVGSAVVRGSAGSVSRTRRLKKCAGGSAVGSLKPLEAAMSGIPVTGVSDLVLEVPVTYPEAAKLQKQLKYADRVGVRYALISGPDERAAGPAGR